jgi:sugar lactone lactonase YvrE
MSKMTNTQGSATRAGLAALMLIAGLGVLAPKDAPADVLYVGDTGDNTIKGFDTDTGAYLGAIVKRSLAGLHGPRGILLDAGGNLIVSDQNAQTSASGDILQYDSASGKLINRIVPHSDPNAPSVPRGIVLSEDGGLFVADVTAQTQERKPVTPGRVRVYTQDGVFLADLVPDSSFPLEQFHPRALVIGPDGDLYVSNMPNPPPPAGNGLGGDVLRFTTGGDFIDAFVQDPGGVGQLNRPEGLVFGPDGRLYITSFRANADDIDSIRVYDSDGSYADSIALDAVGEPRAFAQALLFGPDGRLFVPISGSGPDNGPDTGAVRRYDPGTHDYDDFVPPSAQGGPLGAPWYLSFGATDPATLDYLQ